MNGENCPSEPEEFKGINDLRCPVPRREIILHLDIPPRNPANLAQRRKDAKAQRRYGVGDFFNLETPPRNPRPGRPVPGRSQFQDGGILAHHCDSAHGKLAKLQSCRRPVTNCLRHAVPCQWQKRGAAPTCCFFFAFPQPDNAEVADHGTL